MMINGRSPVWHARRKKLLHVQQVDEQFCENWYGVSAFDSWIHRHKNVDSQGSFVKKKKKKNTLKQMYNVLAA